MDSQQPMVPRTAMALAAVLGTLWIGGLLAPYLTPTYLNLFVLRLRCDGHRLGPLLGVVSLQVAEALFWLTLFRWAGRLPSVPMRRLGMAALALGLARAMHSTGTALMKVR